MFTEIRRVTTRRRRIACALAVCIVAIIPAMVWATATPAAADQDPVVEVYHQSARSTAHVVLSFDAPITRAQAADVRERLEGTVAGDLSSIETLGCNSYMDRPDANGTLTLQLTCLPAHGALAWGYRLSPTIQQIALGPVSEDGLRWWLNGSEQSKNAPHTVPSDYLFHGTMRRVFVDDIIDYQDVITFRHNIGQGGTARVVFAGSVKLTY